MSALSRPRGKVARGEEAQAHGARAHDRDAGDVRGVRVRERVRLRLVGGLEDADAERLVEERPRRDELALVHHAAQVLGVLAHREALRIREPAREAGAPGLEGVEEVGHARARVSGRIAFSRRRASRRVDEHYRRLERMYLQAPINAFYRPRLRISDAACELEIDMRPEFHHAARAVHGSVLFKLLDDSAFFAANSRIPDSFVLTVGFQLHLLRPVSEGTLTARGRLVHQSKRLLLADSVVTNAEGKEVARGTGSFMPSTVALDAGIGYV